MMGVLSLLFVAHTSFAMNPQAIACAKLLVPDDLPIHPVRVELSQGSRRTLRLTDTYQNQDKPILELTFANKKVFAIKTGFVYQNIDNDDIPKEHLIYYDHAVALLNLLNSTDEIRERFGIFNGASATNGHVSHLAWVTPTGEYYSQSPGNFSAMVIDRETLKIKFVIQVEISPKVKSALAKAGFDIGRLIQEYASSLEGPAPTNEELRVYNSKLAHQYGL